MLVSSYVHNIDAKSRVFVPARFRLDLGLHFYVCYWEVDGCLRAYSEEKWKELTDKLKTLTVKKVSAARKIVGEADPVDMDSQGRILLSEKLCRKVGITEQVQFVGMTDWVELWKPEKYDEIINDDSGEDLADILTELGI